ncbi:helix-turn-helix transcriptional regulator [Angelakisella massiliensis]|uniref:helix-turn-helix domain-containing protein n=1 Tax=Angelakisella massiliensis TaxID=1871018 RepID=UPI0024B15190|nr:helix-turn-helix transcriptional regulator [Angelakisella massiliensis]
MSELSERINSIILRTGMKKTAFAERLNVSQAFISQLCSGVSQPSDRTIADICREFRVNEHWLRTGEGEMFLSLSRDEELAAFMGSVMADGSESFRHQLLAALSRLSADQWAVLEAAAWNLVDEMKKTGPQE